MIQFFFLSQKEKGFFKEIHQGQAELGERAFYTKILQSAERAMVASR